MTAIVKTAAAAVEITAFHKDVFAIAQTGQRAAATMQSKMVALLKSKYGTNAPTFEQYRHDRAALRQLAKDKKLADDQWVRKPFCAAIKSLYGALPESMDAAAVQKRAQRDAAKASAKVSTPTAGAPAGQTQEKAPSEAEMLEQLVARMGPLKLGSALVNILKADKSTAAQAVHIEKMLAKVAQIVAEQQSKKVAA